MIKDKKASLFYFLMTLILLDFGSRVEALSYSNILNGYSNKIFSIIHVQNTGSAFSLFQNSSLFLAILGFIAIVLISYYILRHIGFNNKLELLSLTIFISGTLGNMIERIKLGYVIDYIKLNFINFPVFNFFDIMICLGIFLYIIDVLKDNKNQIKG